MSSSFSRREALVVAGTCLGAAMAARPAAAAELASPPAPLRYCLNTGTIRGQKLSLPEQVAVTAQAGYSGIEPWLGDVQQYVEKGGSLADLRKRIADLGLTVESAIGFPAWCVDDDAMRAQGLEQMKRDMDLVRQLGGRRIAAPPAGANATAGLDLRAIGQRYRQALELGREMGVVPQLEIWGSSKTLSRVSEAVFVAVEAAHPDACLLLDAYHIYKGGSDFGGLRLLCGAAMHVFHINDYPADPPRAEVTDAHRVYPGDGVAPLREMLRSLRATGFRGALSLELFNREYWKQDALTVARTGLEKIKAVASPS